MNAVDQPLELLGNLSDLSEVSAPITQNLRRHFTGVTQSVTLLGIKLVPASIDFISESSDRSQSCHLNMLVKVVGRTCQHGDGLSDRQAQIPEQHCRCQSKIIVGLLEYIRQLRRD
ncbi:hypothetical protein LBMAG52_36970 [Planctomycetia bacterium]|nr:hypothetical protein LBMAG52_36970 [Planctomycetia bacterium]